VANLEDEVRRLEPLADDIDFRRNWQAVKADNKRVLARLIKERTDIIIDPHSLFDIQVKRLHEYKRQHLNVLYLVTLYNRLRRSSGAAATPRTVIFGGKAAPGYRLAKLTHPCGVSPPVIVDSQRITSSWPPQNKDLPPEKFEHYSR
jgi:glycogen phosphorylase